MDYRKYLEKKNTDIYDEETYDGISELNSGRKYQGSHICDICFSNGRQKVEAGLACLTCDVYLCNDHGSYHYNKLKTEGRVHTLQRISDRTRNRAHAAVTSSSSEYEPSEYDSEYGGGNSVYCSMHDGQLIRGFCNTCQIPVCGACLLMTHVAPHHEVVPLSVAGKAARTHILEVAAKVIQTSDQLDSHLPELRDTIRNIKDNAMTISNVIKEKFSNLRKQLQARESELLNELKEYSAAEINRVSIVKSEFKTISKKMKDDAKHASLSVNEVSSAEILELAKKMELKLEKFLQQKPQFLKDKKMKGNNVTFSCDNNVEKLIPSIGKVSLGGNDNDGIHDKTKRFAIVAHPVGSEEGSLTWNGEVIVTQPTNTNTVQAPNPQVGAASVLSENKDGNKTKVEVKDFKSGKKKTFYFDKDGKLSI